MELYRCAVVPDCRPFRHIVAFKREPCRALRGRLVLSPVPLACRPSDWTDREAAVALRKGSPLHASGVLTPADVATGLGRRVALDAARGFDVRQSRTFPVGVGGINDGRPDRLVGGRVERNCDAWVTAIFLSCSPSGLQGAPRCTRRTARRRGRRAFRVYLYPPRRAPRAGMRARPFVRGGPSTGTRTPPPEPLGLPKSSAHATSGRSNEAVSSGLGLRDGRIMDGVSRPSVPKRPVRTCSVPLNLPFLF